MHLLISINYKKRIHLIIYYKGKTNIILLPKDHSSSAEGLQSPYGRTNKNTKILQKVLGFKIIKVTLQHQTK